MTTNKLNPYLLFNGTAEKAIKLYQQALGAKTENVQRFSEVPAMPPPAPEHANRIIHAMLTVNDAVLMVSDSMPTQPVTAGGNVAICLNYTELDDMKQKFDALSKDGQVTMPIQQTFWGAHFGMLIDAFAVHWMFNCPIEKA